MKRRKDISEVVEIPQNKTKNDVSGDVKISQNKLIDDVSGDVKISQDKLVNDISEDVKISQDKLIDDVSGDVKISQDKLINDVSEDADLFQDEITDDESEVEENPQDKKRKTIKKVIIAVVVSIISLILLTVAGVLIYLNSVGINYIETENDNKNNNVLLEDIEEDIEEILSNESESLLDEDIEELLGEDSNIIIGEEFDIIIEEAIKPSTETTTKPSAEKPTKPGTETTKPNAEKPTKPSKKPTKPSSSDDDIITAVRDNSDLSASLYKWYNNGGAHMSSKNILNILIVGIDATGGKRMKGNSDVMMLASINKESGKIILCSFLRDSYAYFEDASGTGYYKKLTNAYFIGGADCLLDAIEKNYKIDIDHFVAVDFEAFKQVIDLIGGVNLSITKEEAETIKITMDNPSKKDVPYGNNVVLNGEQALAYSRIRKLYSSGDIQRTQNQRKVINAIIKKSKTLGLGDINSIVQKLGKYIYTDCSSTKIVSLGTSAILGKWYNYKIFSMDAPPENARAVYESPTSWLWVVDYPRSAQYVQKQIYGKSNIAIK